MLRGLTANITQLQNQLDLTYKNSRELNKIVDEKLPGRPHFICEEVTVAGQSFENYRRDIIECIRSLYGDPDFASHLIFAPERHFANPDRTIIVYHDMYTGEWWWEIQVRITQFSCPTMN
jgi:Plavaka transposase